MKSLKISANFLLLASVMLIMKPLNLFSQVDGNAPAITMPLNVEGYVVLKSNDTIYGLIKWPWKYVENNPVEVRFTSRDGVTKTFNASEVNGAGNISSEAFPGTGRVWDDWVSLPSAKKKTPVFMHRLLPGPVTVFWNRSAAIFQTTKTEERTRIDGIGFSWTPDEGLSLGPRYRTDWRVIKSKTRYSSYYVIKGQGPMIKVAKENYAAIFDSLFSDCNEIGAELVKNPDLREFKNFLLLAELYNQLCRQP